MSSRKLSYNKIAITLSVLAITIITLSVVFHAIVGSYSRYILDRANISKNTPKIGIVFGAGVAPNGKPYDELAGRLDGAIEMYNLEVINKIIVSGDNRFDHYNEPLAMQNYLTERDIPADAIYQDSAGRSTYETCERANKIFQLQEALLITSESHLPRALFTCRKLGINSVGIAYGPNSNNATRREFMASTKTIINIYIYGERTILGDPIDI